MAFYRAQISVPVDSTLPRDRMVITPHFNVSGAAPTPDALATSLGDKMATWLTGTVEVNVKLYLAGTAGPHIPLANYTKNANATPIVSQAPREVAVCLSYFSTVNVKRQRGRLYIPISWIHKKAGLYSMAARPDGAQRTLVSSLATDVLKGVSASGAQWGFWSYAGGQFRAVTDYWIDDEWDIQRKRGTRPTTRLTGTA